MSLLGIVLIILLVLALTGGLTYHSGAYWGGGSLGLILVIVLIVVLLGRF